MRKGIFNSVMVAGDNANRPLYSQYNSSCSLKGDLISDSENTII